MNIVNIEMLKYFIVSGVALAFDTITFSLALRVFHIDWYIAISLSFLIGVSVAYFLSIFWIFKERALKNEPQLEFFIFILIGLLGLLLTQGILWFGIYILNTTPEIVRVAAAGITFIFNFIIRKFLLFNHLPKE
jgi:putative flippase GtrA